MADKKLTIKKSEDGKTEAYITVEMGLGKVITESKSICGLYHNGAMALYENAIQNILVRKCKGSAERQKQYEEIKELFEGYFQSKFCLDLGIAAFNLKLNADGTVDGFVKGREDEFEIVIEGEIENGNSN